MKSRIVDDTISWLGVQTSSKKVQICLRRVLQEMVGEGLLILRDRRLQIAVLEHSVGMGEVWAYFPAHRRRWIAKYVDLKSTTRIVLVICAPGVERRPSRETEKELRRHIGHVLRYPANPLRRQKDELIRLLCEGARVPRNCRIRSRSGSEIRLNVTPTPYPGAL